MPYFRPIIFTLLWLFGLLIPGFYWLLLRRWGLAFAVPLLALVWVITFSVTRWVVTPLGFKVFIVGLVAWHAGHYLAALIAALRGMSVAGQALPWHTLAIQVTLGALLINVNLGIVLGSHFYKAHWFGFAFYHIPSASMQPTLYAGDVVLVDTWAYLTQAPSVGDVIVFKRSARGMVMVKRLNNARNINGQWQLYLLGDNPTRSQDSRHFGWLSTDEFDSQATPTKTPSLIIGQAVMVWFSFSKTTRFAVNIN